jgi:Tol biopolymer transport system component
MSLVAGTRLGPYEILTELGAGGMGEVYRARDTRLERAVAVKILPSRLSSDPAHKQRFEREAKAISHLNHPHICVLHDIGHQDGIDYLVMECVEGETLAKRLEKGPPPLEQVLKYGMQIADALDKAHRSNVVHRDLKPGNIMLTPTGAKLLDFGLAKPVAPLTSAATLTATPAKQSPATEQGTIVGTFQYMSPEQIEGKELDGRSDLFSLGAVLYEMLTGQRAFQGKSQLSVASAILEKDPAPITSVKPMTPHALDHAIRRCLAKDPEDRWQTARDLALELKWIAEKGSQAGALPPFVAAGSIRGRLGWAGALAALVLFGLALFVAGYFNHPMAQVQTIRASLPPPSNAAFTVSSSVAGSVAISPDGRLLAFTAEAKGNTPQLWVRSLDTLVSRPLAGTEYAFAPFWSPDSKWIAFFSTNGKLKKVEALGGLVETLCDAPFGRGGTWNRNGLIVFAPNIAQPLFQVPATGGTPTPITQLDASRQENTHRWPQFLPDGMHYIFFVRAGVPSGTGLYIGTLGSGERQQVTSISTNALYASPGYLLFGRGDTLMAQPFDAGRMRVTGEPTVAAQDVSFMPAPNFVNFSVSQTGLLVYSSGTVEVGRQLAWYDRQGRLISKLGSPEYSSWPQLSPDGKRLAIRLLTPPAGAFDIWVYDLARGVHARMSFSALTAYAPVWSPDGTQLAYAHSVSQAGGDHMYVLNPDGAGKEQALEQPLIESIANYPSSWSPEGRLLLFDHQDKSGKISIWVLPLAGDRKPYPFAETQFNAQAGKFSPDGHRVAYVSNDSGKDEVYVAPFPGPGGRVQVSSGGGSQPRWRRDGRELFYLSPDLKMMAAELTATAGDFRVVRVRTLFAVSPLGGVPGYLYDVTPDGQKFIVAQDFEHTSTVPLTIVTNWPAELKK